MPGFMGLQTRFKGWKGLKPGNFRQKGYKYWENPEKLVEIKVFWLTLPRPKSHCNERRV
jgi:hypothetical protein